MSLLSTPASTSASRRRLRSGMTSRSMTSSRSARSPRTAPRSIPFSTNAAAEREQGETPVGVELTAHITIAGHRAAERVARASPAIVEMLSIATTHDPAAAVTQDSASRGDLRSGTGDGSINEVMIFAPVDFAVPCSPARFRIGCGISAIMAATSHANTNGRSGADDVQQRPQLGQIPTRHRDRQRGSQDRAAEAHHRVRLLSTRCRSPGSRCRCCHRHRSTTTRRSGRPAAPSASGSAPPAIPSMTSSASAKACCGAALPYCSK